MKRHGVSLITAVLAAAAAAGCFSDPTSSQQNGPALIQLTRAAAVVPIGDSTLIEARLVDEAGNLLPMTGATWTTDNAAIADVHVAAVQLPEDASSKAYVLGIATLGGITTVRVTARGITDSVRITALPTHFMGAGTMAVTGTATADTAGTTAFTAGDTLTITAPSTMAFDAAASAITLGGQPTRLLSRSATSISAIAYKGYIGRAEVSEVTWLGSGTTGNYSVGTLSTSDSVTLARARFHGTVTVAASAFGANTQMTLKPQAGMTFNAGATGVFFGGSPATILTRTTDSIVVIATATYTGIVKVTNTHLTGSGITVDSLFTPGPSTINAAFFPGTVVQGGTGRLLDTIYVIGGANADFVTSGAGASNVTINGVGAFMLRRATDTLYAIAKVPGTSAVSVTGVVIPGPTTIPALSTSGTTTVSTTTGDVNEPGNDASATATTLTLANVGDSAVVYAAMDGTTDVRDYYKFTQPGGAASTTVSVRIDFFGNGSGSDDLNPDFDVVVCTTLSGTGSCSYGQDIIPNNAGSQVNNPELGTTTAVVGGTTVFVRTFEYFATGAGIGSYRLRVKTP